MRFPKLSLNNMVLLILGWRRVDSFISCHISPPPENVRVEVRDADGNRAIAFATWVPFKVVKMPGDERKPWGWRGTPIPCQSYWDGGWLIDCSDMNINKIGDIKYWRRIKNK